MKSIQLLKTAVFLCGTFLFSSCLLPEDVVDSSGFEQPVRILSVTPDSAFVGDNIVITGENFIPKKEYNQVWFSGNVKANIDSATTTKLFLKVPEGAQTSAISVSNGVYSDTLNIDFKVLKESIFKKVSLAFDGIKVNRYHHNWGWGQISPSQGISLDTSFVDNLVMKRKFDSLYHSNININLLKNYITYNWACDNQKKTVSNLAFIASQKVPDTFVFFVAEIEIDTLNMMIQNFEFIHFFDFQKSKSGVSGSDANCLGLRMVLSKLSYTIVNGRKIVALNSEQLKKCLLDYREYTYRYDFQTNVKDFKYESRFNTVSEILPDAYFELTLE